MDRLGHMEISYFWIGQETYDITNQGQVPSFPSLTCGAGKARTQRGVQGVGSTRTVVPSEGSRQRTRPSVCQ